MVPFGLHISARGDISTEKVSAKTMEKGEGQTKIRVMRKRGAQAYPWIAPKKRSKPLSPEPQDLVQDLVLRTW